MGKKLIPAVSYCRVSSSSTDQIHSYDAQIKYFREKANELGYKLIDGIGTFGDGIYADKGISGKSITKRNEFLKMIKDSEKGKFEAILVTNVSRFSRNAVDGMETIRNIKKNNIYVHFLKENLKSCNYSDEFLMDFFMVFAQNELRDMSKKIQAGMRKAQDAGVWTSHAPFGYDKVNGYLQINEVESAIVKMIFDLYTNKGYSLNKISTYLNSEGIKSKKNRGWQQSTIRRLITNPIYIGMQINHQIEMEDIFIGMTRRTDINEWITHQFNHLQIIDNKTFELTQIRIKERAEMLTSKTKYSSVHVLSNLFYCGNCGAAMKRVNRVQVKTTYKYFLCSNRHRDKIFCQNYNYIKESDILKFILDKIDEKISEEKNNTKIINTKEIYDMYVEDNLGNEFIKQLPKIIEKIDRLENRKKNHINMYADGDLTKDEFRKHKKELDEELDILNKNRNKIENLSTEVKKVYQIYDQFIENLKSFNKDKMENSKLKKIIKKIIITTTNNKKTINIVWNSGLDKGFTNIIDDYTTHKNEV